MNLSSKFSSWDNFKNRNINAWALVLFSVDPVVSEYLPFVLERQRDIQLEGRIAAHKMHYRDRTVYPGDDPNDLFFFFANAKLHLHW